MRNCTTTYLANRNEQGRCQMSVDQTKVVDFIGVDKETGEVILTISDHMEWGQNRDHISILQGKLDTYLAFVESGELLERYPDAKNRRLRFDVVCKFRPDALGLEFLAKAKQAIEQTGIGLKFEVFAESYDN